MRPLCNKEMHARGRVADKKNTSRDGGNCTVGVGYYDETKRLDLAPCYKCNVRLFHEHSAIFVNIKKTELHIHTHILLLSMHTKYMSYFQIIHINDDMDHYKYTFNIHHYGCAD